MVSKYVNMATSACPDMGTSPIFRLLFFELWSILYSKLLENLPKVAKKSLSLKNKNIFTFSSQKMHNALKRIFLVQ